jgi:hypothetical protein
VLAQSEIDKLLKLFADLQKVTERQARESIDMRENMAKLIDSNSAMLDFIREKGLYLEYIATIPKGKRRMKKNG